MGDIFFLGLAERRLRKVFSCALQFRIAAVIQKPEEGKAAEMAAGVLEAATEKRGERDVIVHLGFPVTFKSPYPTVNVNPKFSHFDLYIFPVKKKKCFDSL